MAYMTKPGTGARPPRQGAQAMDNMAISSSEPLPRHRRNAPECRHGCASVRPVRPPAAPGSGSVRRARGAHRARSARARAAGRGSPSRRACTETAAVHTARSPTSTSGHRGTRRRAGGQARNRKRSHRQCIQTGISRVAVRERIHDHELDWHVGLVDAGLRRSSASTRPLAQRRGPGRGRSGQNCGLAPERTACACASMAPSTAPMR